MGTRIKLYKPTQELILKITESTQEDWDAFQHFTALQDYIQLDETVYPNRKEAPSFLMYMITDKHPKLSRLHDLDLFGFGRISSDDYELGIVDDWETAKRYLHDRAKVHCEENLKKAIQIMEKEFFPLFIEP